MYSRSDKLPEAFKTGGGYNIFFFLKIKNFNDHL